MRIWVYIYTQTDTHTLKLYIKKRGCIQVAVLTFRSIKCMGWKAPTLPESIPSICIVTIQIFHKGIIISCKMIRKKFCYYSFWNGKHSQNDTYFLVCLSSYFFSFRNSVTLYRSLDFLYFSSRWRRMFCAANPKLSSIILFVSLLFQMEKCQLLLGTQF